MKLQYSPVLLHHLMRMPVLSRCKGEIVLPFAEEAEFEGLWHLDGRVLFLASYTVSAGNPDATTTARLLPGEAESLQGGMHFKLLEPRPLIEDLQAGPRPLGSRIRVGRPVVPIVMRQVGSGEFWYGPEFALVRHVHLNDGFSGEIGNGAAVCLEALWSQILGAADRQQIRTIVYVPESDSSGQQLPGTALQRLGFTPTFGLGLRRERFPSGRGVFYEQRRRRDGP